MVTRHPTHRHRHEVATVDTNIFIQIDKIPFQQFERQCLFCAPQCALAARYCTTHDTARPKIVEYKAAVVLVVVVVDNV